MMMSVIGLRSLPRQSQTKIMLTNVLVERNNIMTAMTCLVTNGGLYQLVCIFYVYCSRAGWSNAM